MEFFKYLKWAFALICGAGVTVILYLIGYTVLAVIALILLIALSTMFGSND